MSANKMSHFDMVDIFRRVSGGLLVQAKWREVFYYIYDFGTAQSSSTIIIFADDKALLGLISNNSEIVYRHWLCGER